MTSRFRVPVKWSAADVPVMVAFLVPQNAGSASLSGMSGGLLGRELSEGPVGEGPADVLPEDLSWPAGSLSVQALQQREGESDLAGSQRRSAPARPRASHPDLLGRAGRRRGARRIWAVDRTRRVQVRWAWAWA